MGSVAIRSPDGVSHPREAMRAEELLLDAAACPVRSASVVISAVTGGCHARRVATRSRHAVLGAFPSFKMSTTFPSESNIETGVMTLADVLEDVRAFRPQALRVVFPYRGRLARAYPDIAVIRADGSPELWECKPDGRVGAETVARMVALHAALRAVGIRYVVRQPRWSRRAPLAGNAALIRRYADEAVSEDAFAEAATAVRRGASTFGELALRVGAPVPTLLALAARGAFAVDIGRVPLQTASLVRETIPGATSGAFDGNVDSVGG